MSVGVGWRKTGRGMRIGGLGLFVRVDRSRFAIVLWNRQRNFESCQEGEDKRQKYQMQISIKYYIPNIKATEESLKPHIPIDKPSRQTKRMKLRRPVSNAYKLKLTATKHPSRTIHHMRDASSKKLFEERTVLWTP